MTDRLTDEERSKADWFSYLNSRLALVEKDAQTQNTTLQDAMTEALSIKVPDGGTVGQVLTKQGDETNGWSNPVGAAQ